MPLLMGLLGCVLLGVAGWMGVENTGQPGAAVSIGCLIAFGFGFIMIGIFMMFVQTRDNMMISTKAIIKRIKEPPGK